MNIIALFLGCAIGALIGIAEGRKKKINAMQEDWNDMQIDLQEIDNAVKKLVKDNARLVNENLRLRNEIMYRDMDLKYIAANAKVVENEMQS